MNWISRSHTDQLYRELLSSDSPVRISTSELLLRRAIAREIYRREGIKCLDRVAFEGNEQAMGFLFCTIASAEPELAKSELQARGLSMELNLVLQMTIDALKASAVRGASELLKSENLWGEGVGMGYTEFAEDFNFREYLSQTSSSAGKVEAFKYLAAKDPDEAAACMLEGFQWEIAGSMLDGRSAVAGRQEAIKWMADEIGKVPDRYRKMELNDLARHCDARDSEMMMNQLGARQDRLDFAVSSISQFRDEKIEYFATLPEEFRISVMNQWLESIRLTNWGKDPEMALKMMDQMKIPAEQYEALLKVQSGVAN
ncbi:hypothetical protein [Luteolibacter pohnpeiensis]|nr:hypothetical protein [Luteolibacter pohnpeiensis]